jgi:hypothetical protein
MTHPNKTISPLRERMIEDMTMRKLSPKTQTQYIRALKKTGPIPRSLTQHSNCRRSAVIPARVESTRCIEHNY